MDSNPAKRRKIDHQASLEPEPANTAAALNAAATAGTSRPSTFVLQTQELLDEVRIDYDKSFPEANTLLHQIKCTLESIDPHGPIPIHQAAETLETEHDVHVPFPEPRPLKDSPYKVSFMKPAELNVVGSYVSRTMVKSQRRRGIDVIVEMPRNIFQEKDYLNVRYFFKRAYYLAVLSVAIQKKFAVSIAVTFGYLNGNRLLPVLLLTPRTASKDSTGSTKPPQDYHIRVIPCAPEDLFPSHKLLHTNCCIRSAPGRENSKHTPTPFYNSTLKADTRYVSYLRVIRKAESSCPAFRDACMLGRVWLQQRGLGGSISAGGFGHFEWSLVTALLLQGSGGRRSAAALSPSLSSPQIFKVVIRFLAGTDLSKKPLVLGASNFSFDAADEPLPIIFDSVRQLNVAYKMSSWSASMLHRHAKWTHLSLADHGTDQFNSTFIVKADIPLQAFDLLVRIDGVSTGDAIQDYRGDSWAYCNRVTKILKRALTDRVELIHLWPAEDQSDITWSVNSSISSKPSAIFVGILFNGANMARQVDYGPTAEDKEAAKIFRQFWGEKAELRRFKDGSILESLIWTQTSPLALCEEIIRYILKQHLCLEDEHLSFTGKQFSSILPFKSSDILLFQTAKQAFSVFERDLRSLADLPLQIRQVAATTPALRFTSILPPPLSAAKGAPQPMDTTLYFEASGKWPENVSAIQRTKVAFLLRIGDLLSEYKPEVVCRIGLEEVHTEIENPAFLDVAYEDGAIFRLRIHSDMEESLLERRAKDKATDHRLRTKAAQHLASFRRLYTHLPLHTQAISTFCSRFPALSPTIRLVKYWFDCHKLSIHFLEEALELLALKAFLEPYPWQAPSSAMTGFLRTLQFLSRWDWRTEPLILDFTGELPSLERSAIETRLEAWRKIDPGMSHTTLVVATCHETSGTAYTIHGGRPLPAKVVATRMTTLARSACKLVKHRGASLEPQDLFQPSLNDYDVLIHLNSRVLQGISRGDAGAKPSQFKNLDRRIGKMTQPHVRQPARSLLTRLESLFGGHLLLFHGSPDDAIIAGIWNPQMQRRTFRVNLPCSFRPIVPRKENDEEASQNELVELNRESIIAEIARIGGDCIESVYFSNR